MDLQRKADLMERSRLLLALARYQKFEDMPEHILSLVLDDNIDEETFGARLHALRSGLTERRYIEACNEVAALAHAVIRKAHGR
jgi:hypothetical protein